MTHWGWTGEPRVIGGEQMQMEVCSGRSSTEADQAELWGFEGNDLENPEVSHSSFW